MPLDETLVTETKQWFLKASRDLRVAELALNDEPPLLDQTAFHAQQAVEKALKGFLVWHGQIFRKVHNIEEIGEQCLELDNNLNSLIERAVPLTEYSSQFRYPGEVLEPSLEEAKAALELAHEVFDTIITRLPPEVRP